MAGRLMQSALTYKCTLERILEERKTVEKKTSLHEQAFECGARALEHANKNGARYFHEAAIMRYHAVQPLAIVAQDDYTRKAIKAAILEIGRMVESGADFDD